VYEGAYIDTFHNKKNEPTDSILDEMWEPKISLQEGIRKVFTSMCD